MSVYVKS